MNCRMAWDLSKLDSPRRPRRARRNTHPINVVLLRSAGATRTQSRDGAKRSRRPAFVHGPSHSQTSPRIRGKNQTYSCARGAKTLRIQIFVSTAVTLLRVLRVLRGDLSLPIASPGLPA